MDTIDDIWGKVSKGFNDTVDFFSGKSDSGKSGKAKTGKDKKGKGKPRVLAELEKTDYWERRAANEGRF
jgi:hypothetical protein